jgi:hypothetical protein
MKAKNKKSSKNLTKKGVLRIAGVVGGLLLIPLVLTLINPNATMNGGKGGGWDWALGDFVVMGTLLFVTGLAIDFVARRITDPLMRVFAVAVIVFALLVVWAEFAVDAVSRFISAVFR